MSVVEKGAAGCQTVKVGGEGLRISAEATDPIVEIVDRNEEDIRTRWRVLFSLNSKG